MKKPKLKNKKLYGLMTKDGEIYGVVYTKNIFSPPDELSNPNVDVVELDVKFSKYVFKK